MKISKEQYQLLHSVLNSAEDGLIEKVEINFNGKIDPYQGRTMDASVFRAGNPSISFELCDMNNDEEQLPNTLA